MSAVTGRSAAGPVSIDTAWPAARLRPAIALASVAFLVGLCFRWVLRAHATPDASSYYLWFQYARDHGMGALHDAFTNYTPFYSYLLLVAVQFEKLGAPLVLIKAISVCFELGCAIVVAEMVWQVTRVPLRTALAFAGIWLAPTALFNGAAWAQADSIWTFFVLLCVSLSMRHRNGMLPFAMGVSVKAQAVFLGPFVLGMVLRRRIHWAWLAALPLVYVAVAIPVLVAGRPLASVLEVYLDQAETFRDLTRNAANIWLFAGSLPYEVGVPIGLALAGAVGLALAVFMARVRRDDPTFILLAACLSLLLMPLLLPKMHERYFYAFELASIALACVQPRYLAFAVLAQVDGVLAYCAFDPGISIGLPAAAICNILLGVYLVMDGCGGRRAALAPIGVWIAYLASCAALLGYAILHPSASNDALVAKVLTAAVVGSAFPLLHASRQEGSVALDAPLSAEPAARP